MITTNTEFYVMVATSVIVGILIYDVGKFIIAPKTFQERLNEVKQKRDNYESNN